MCADALLEGGEQHSAKSSAFSECIQSSSHAEAPRAGYRITACAATPHQAAFVLSIPTRPVFDETQETLRTSAFPSSHVQAWPGRFST